MTIEIIAGQHPAVHGEVGLSTCLATNYCIVLLIIIFIIDIVVCTHQPGNSGLSPQKLTSAVRKIMLPFELSVCYYLYGWLAN